MMDKTDVEKNVFLSKIIIGLCSTLSLLILIVFFAVEVGFKIELRQIIVVFIAAIIGFIVGLVIQKN